MLGKNFSLFKEHNLQHLQCKEEESTEELRDEAVAKNGDYERSEKENQIKRKSGRYKQMVGSRAAGGRL